MLCLWKLKLKKCTDRHVVVWSSGVMFGSSFYIRVSTVIA